MFNKILIHRLNIINNLKHERLENPDQLICAMVKANAYGVGLDEVVQILDGKVDFFGVSCFFEAKRVREISDAKILIVGPLEYGLIDESFSYTCNSLSDIETLIATSRPINIHIKVNTGMNRYGFSSLKELKRALNLIKCSNLHLEGVFTHFATADEHVDLQMKKFYKYLRLLKDYNFSPIIHADNSFVSETKNHHLDMVRIGFNLYNRESHWYVPAVEIRSTIVDVKTVKKGDLVGYDYRFVAHGSMRVAILPIGYADGFDIRYIGADIIVGDTKCRVLNICMDCFMLDISNTDLKKGDEISIIDKSNSLKYFANYSRTSEYEVMTKFSHMRAVRIVV